MVDTKSYIKKDDIDELTHKTVIKKYSEKKLSYSCYEDAVLFPYIKFTTGGGCDKEGHYICNTSLHERRDDNAYQNRVYQYDKRDLVIDNNEAIFIGTFCNIYGHAITDNLKKIWFLQTNTFNDLVARGCKIVFLHCDNYKPISEIVIRILKYAGLDYEKATEVKQITRFKKLYIPDDSSTYDPYKDIRYYTIEFKNTIERIKTNIVYHGAKYDKLYFSRSNFSSIKDIGIGEKVIESYFTEHGYHIIYPEKISFEEQVGMITNCNYFAATEGSISHNSIFCKDNANIIILRKSNWINPYQLVINEMIKANVIYIDAHHSFINKEEPWLGPYYVFPTKELCKFFKKEHKINRWIRYDWYLYLTVLLKNSIRHKFPKFHSFIRANIRQI